MNALNSLMGRPGEPNECRTIAGISVHWWTSGAQVGDPCLCGETVRKQMPVGYEDEAGD